MVDGRGGNGTVAAQRVVDELVCELPFGRILRDDEAVMEIFESALSVDVKDKLFVSCSTITPQTTEKLSELVKAKGAGFVSMTSMSRIRSKSGGF